MPAQGKPLHTTSNPIVRTRAAWHCRCSRRACRMSSAPQRIQGPESGGSHMRDLDSGLRWKRSSTRVRCRNYSAWAPVLSDDDRRAIEEIRRQIDMDFAPSAVGEVILDERPRWSASRVLPSLPVMWGLLAGFLLGGAVAGTVFFYTRTSDVMKVSEASHRARAAAPSEPAHPGEVVPPPAAVAGPATAGEALMPAPAGAVAPVPATAGAPSLPPGPERTRPLLSSWTAKPAPSRPHSR